MSHCGQVIEVGKGLVVWIMYKYVQSLETLAMLLLYFLNRRFVMPLAMESVVYTAEENRCGNYHHIPVHLGRFRFRTQWENGEDDGKCQEGNRKHVDDHAASPARVIL